MESVYIAKSILTRVCDKVTKSQKRQWQILIMKKWLHISMGSESFDPTRRVPWRFTWFSVKTKRFNLS